MFLAFQEKFRDELRLGIRSEGGRTDWISTDHPLDRPQWNASINPDDPRCFLGVNVEKADRLFSSTDIHRLSDCMAQLPVDARCELSRVQFHGRRQRTWLPIRRAAARLVADELDGLANLVHTLDNRESLAYTVGFPLWGRNEAFSRQVHNARLDEAYKVLMPLYSAVGGEG